MTSDTTSDPGQTFLFADLAGFTALTEAHGDVQAADLAEDFSQQVAALAGDHDAETIKTIGDAVLLRVVSASSSIRLGLAIVHELREADGFPAVRVGMHSGSAVERAGDWFGSTVNIAARVSAAAGGGQVLVTDVTRAAGGPIEGVTFETLGERMFRNVAEPVPLFEARQEARVQGQLDIDPVCQMTVAPGRSVGTLTFGGDTYHFCSLECVGKFVSAPERFAATTTSGESSESS